MKKIIAFLLAMMMLFAFAACGDEKSEANPAKEPAKTEEKAPAEEKASIVGTWKYDGSSDYAYIFNEDGTGSYTYGDSAMKFDYTDDGEKVEISFEGTTSPNVYKYSVEGDNLLIEDSFGDTVTYIKK